MSTLEYASQSRLIAPGPAPRPGVLRRLLGESGERSFWMLSDQAVASIGNFVTSNLLANHLVQKDYGAYGILLETLLFLNSLQAALINYPLTLKGAAGDDRGLRRLATASIWFTICLLPLLGGAMMGAAFATGLSGVVLVAGSAAAAMLLWQVQETMRRALISEMRIAESILGDSISYLGQAAGVFLLIQVKRLNLTNAFLVIGGTSALALVVQAAQIGLARVSWHELGELALDFWRDGRWMLLSNLTIIITGISFMWTLKFSGGLEAVAIFSAIVMLIKLANPLFSSVGSLIVPGVARALKGGGTKAATRAAVMYSLLGGAILVPYFGFLIVAPQLAMKLAYKANSPYIQYAWLLRLYVINYTFVYIAAVLGAWLCGLGASRANFQAQFVHTCTVLLIGLPCTMKWGVPGLIAGAFVSIISSVAATAYFLRRVNHGLAPAATHIPPPDTNLAAAGDGL